MGTYDPIAYTYDADWHCPACTEERFGRGEHGFIAEDAEDAEGNSVGAVAPWDSWRQGSAETETLTCGDCHGVMDTCEPADFQPVGINLWREHRAVREFDPTDQDPT